MVAFLFFFTIDCADDIDFKSYKNFPPVNNAVLVESTPQFIVVKKGTLPRVPPSAPPEAARKGEICSEGV
jgi:hypothetical protein